MPKESLNGGNSLSHIVPRVRDHEQGPCSSRITSLDLLYEVQILVTLFAKSTQTYNLVILYTRRERYEVIGRSSCIKHPDIPGGRALMCGRNNYTSISPPYNLRVKNESIAITRELTTTAKNTP